MGKIIKIWINSDKMTIEDLMIQIEKERGLPVESQRLIFGGFQLEKDRSLHDYNIQKGDLLHLVLRLTKQT
uniref:Ubiquitin-like domain-containing protein n=1 Tax=Arcella intermedia TaxID=1963864 RepID=A0A6B2LVY3_9EUKA